MTINLCTYFDSRYLAKGLALLGSLADHLPDFRCYVLTLDGHAFETVGTLAVADKRIQVVPLRTLEHNKPRLEQARSVRSHKEFIWTLTPSWTLYLLERFELPDLAYIDADCYLFGDLGPLYAELAAASVAVIPHRWTPRHADRLRANGQFNVGWVYFRNDVAGRACLEYWQTQCLDWKGAPGTFSDQRFLDGWPEQLGEHLHVVRHLGANLAPWNAEQYSYQFANDRLWIERPVVVDDMGIGHASYDPLLFYHFHEFALRPHGVFYRTGYPVPELVAAHVYEPYEQEIAHVSRAFA